MAEIVNLAGKFTWMTYGSTDHNRVHNCDVVKHLTGGVFSVTGRKTGYDATQPWWTQTPPVLGKKRAEPDLDPGEGEETSNTPSSILRQSPHANLRLSSQEGLWPTRAKVNRTPLVAIRTEASRIRLVTCFNK